MIFYFKGPCMHGPQGYSEHLPLQTARLPTTAETERNLANCFALVFVRPCNLEATVKPVAETAECQRLQLAPTPRLSKCPKHTESQGGINRDHKKTHPFSYTLISPGGDSEEFQVL